MSNVFIEEQVNRGDAGEAMVGRCRRASCGFSDRSTLARDRRTAGVDRATSRRAARALNHFDYPRVPSIKTFGIIILAATASYEQRVQTAV